MKQGGVCTTISVLDHHNMHHTRQGYHVKTASTPHKHRTLDVSCAFGTTYDSPWTHRLASALTAAALSLQAFTAAPAPALALTTPDTITLIDQVDAITTTPVLTPEQLQQLPPIPTTFPALPTLQLPKYERFKLSNGLRVILLEDHEVPVVRAVVLMKGGQRAVPSDRVGMASIAAATQRAGGSMGHPGQVLDAALEDKAAVIEGGAAGDFTSMGFECLAEDAPQVLDLFTEVIASPLIPEDKVELFKAQGINSTLHRNDDPSSIPQREISNLIYGPDSVYVRQASVASIGRITGQGIKDWLSEWQRPDTSVLGVVGDFNARDMKQLLEGSLGAKWQRPAPPALPLPTSPIPDHTSIAGKVYFVDRPGANQTSIAMAEEGILFGDPDECALDILGSLLNNFGGRLFDGIRSREGLAYSVSASWSGASIDHPGLFLATAETARPAELLSALRSALNQAAATRPATEEVESAKEESLNAFVFAFASPQTQLRRAVAFELLGIPSDYLFRYRDGLSKVTANNVAAAAARHLHPGKETIIVVGDAAKVKQDIENALGVKVEPLNVDRERVDK